MKERRGQLHGSERRLIMMGPALPNLRVGGLLARVDEVLLAQVSVGMCKSFGPLRYRLGLMPSAACLIHSCYYYV
jgi:hypothetical protein